MLVYARGYQLPACVLIGDPSRPSSDYCYLKVEFSARVQALFRFLSVELVERSPHELLKYRGGNCLEATRNSECGFSAIPPFRLLPPTT